MKSRTFLLRLVAAALLGMGALIGLWVVSPFAGESAGPTSLALKAPSFISVARAESDAGVNFMENEAGISAYTNAGQAIDLNLVRTFYRSIERSTADYIIGSVPAPGYVGVGDSEEQVDAHVYIHRDGWIVAYYLKDAPATKMINWPNYNPDKLSRNNLSDIIKQIFASFGIVSSAIAYYDFRYPNANSLMLIADLETTDNEVDTFTLQIPGSVTVFERSWSLASFNSGAGSTCKLNQEVLFEDTGCNNCWRTKYGLLNTLQMPVDTLHTVTASYNVWYTGLANNGAYCAIGLVYKETP